MSKMQVIFVKQTGHVLAAFTRAADPEGLPSVKALVGDGLLVRDRTIVSPASSGGETLLVPPEALDVSAADFDSDVFVSPSSHTVGGGVVARLGSPSTPPTVAFSASTVTFTLPGAATDTATEDIPVWARLEEAQPSMGNTPERRIAEGKIEKNHHDAILEIKTASGGVPASLPSTSYFILALISGYQPLFDRQSV